MTMNGHHARSGHPARTTLQPPPTGETPLITDTGRPDDPADRCGWRLPGTDIRCRDHVHPERVACTATGERDGVHFHAVWWRPGT
jgi:hypothetical protein